jgi:isopenicillin-N epimerase
VQDLLHPPILKGCLNVIPTTSESPTSRPHDADPARAFGHARRDDFDLMAGMDHLNHGAYGSTPRAALDAAHRWRARMEADPSIFFRRDLPGLLRQAGTRVATVLGGRGEDWAFVENATAGMNAIIDSIPLAPGDELVCLSQVYGAVRNALEHRASRSGARVVVVPVPVPFVDPEPLLTGLRAAITSRSRLVTLDHVTSPGATVLPVADLVAVCRDAEVPVAIDGAHAPGMLALDVPSLGADWYVGNLHKWAFAPRGTGVLWCAPARQADLHPLAISHYYGQGFTAEFDYCGTRDNSAWLASGAGLDYLEGPGPDRLRDHNNRLAREAGEMLARRWGSELAAAPEFLGSMAAIRLPNGAGGTRAHGRDLSTRLTEQHRISCAVLALQGGLWLRVSAQIYNEPSDYERLAIVGASLCA